MTALKAPRRSVSTRALVAASTLAVLAGGLAAVEASAAGPEPKVTICHRTNSTKNPYVVITVAQSSVDGSAGKGNGNGDHYLNHTGPIWTPSQPNGGDWGDIIPPIPGVHDGLNWTSQGQAIWAAGCYIAAAVNVVVDIDGDGKPDPTDPDNDNDGKPDTTDPDDNNNGIPDTEEIDTDTDGTPNGTDKDDDGDGKPDIVDLDSNGDGKPDVITNPDTDNDGKPDSVDRDDDADGRPDTTDPDSNGDGITETENQTGVIPPGIPGVLDRDEVYTVSNGITDDGRQVVVVVLCRAAVGRAAIHRAGDIAAQRCIVRRSGGRTTLEIVGGAPHSISISWLAGAVGDYKGVRYTRIYRVR